MDNRKVIVVLNNPVFNFFLNEEEVKVKKASEVSAETSISEAEASAKASEDSIAEKEKSEYW